MCRCVGCDAILDYNGRVPLKEGTNEEEDLCNNCLGEVYSIDEPEDKTYPFQDVTDRLFHSEANSCGFSDDY
jgi:hypothetical protein